MSQTTLAVLQQLQRENAQLRARNDDLELERDELRRELGTQVSLPRWLPRLTKNEAKLLGVFIARPLVTRSNAMLALYGSAEDWPQEKIIDVFLARLRAKLKHTAVEIETDWGRGWRLTPASRERLQPKQDEAQNDA